MADAPPKKKLPFKQRKKPTEPTPTSSGEKAKAEDELDLFSRRRDMLPILEADRKRRLAKEKRKAEAQAREQAREKEETEGRRRMISEKRPLEDEDEEFYDAKERMSLGGTADEDVVAMAESTTVRGDSFKSVSLDASVYVPALTLPSKPATPPPSKRTRTESRSASSRHHATPSTSARREGSPSSRRASRLLSTMSTPSKASNKPAPAVISLDSEDDEADVKPAVNPQPQPRTVGIVDDMAAQDDLDEGDEYAEYIRKAEEEKKRVAAEAGTARVFLTSEIEGTQPVESKMKLDQPLVKLRDAWVQTQLYAHNVRLPCPAADLVISWQRSKVYNYSSLYSLGIRVQGESVTGVDRKGLTSDRKKVHLEISTPEIYQRWEAERERQRRKDEAQDLSEDEVFQVVEEDVKLKVILKACNLEDVKVTVRPATTAETLISAYRRLRKEVDETKTVTLWFDGDQLANNSTLEEVDINEMDIIDVHIN